MNGSNRVVPLVVPGTTTGSDVESQSSFLNRELTWLNFNFRVLHEAEDPRTPLLERVKFLSIVSSNLDEFVMKRIGGLKQQVGAGVQKPTVDGRTPQQQIDECNSLVLQLEQHQRAVLAELLAELGKHDIALKTWDELGDDDRAYLRDYYLENIYPLVTPQAVDPAHPFPFISNLSLNLLVSLRYAKDPLPSLARVKVPMGAETPRFVRLRDSDTYVPLESVMAHNLDLLFPGMEVESWTLFRVTRNANTERDEESAEDLLELIEKELRQRKFAPIVRLEVEERMDARQRGMIAAELGLDEHADVSEVHGLMALRDLIELCEVQQADLHYRAHQPATHPMLIGDRSMFHVVRDQGPLLLQHPYESFTSSVERFLKEASRDPKVRALKMILYRTSADSRAIGYLLDAAGNGKQVTVVVELKARFDEAANIRWANRLEEAGIHVTYGVLGLKTHCKAILVVRQDFDGIRRYAHIGTGNYNAHTARLYSDIGMLTCDPAIGRDLTELFNYLTTGYKPKRSYAKLLPAPKLLKDTLLDKIAREIELHESGVAGLIQIKTNALQDPDLIRALYHASQTGVRVELIVRDSCCLRPGVPGLSDNISVVSIVGRFLEHSRIYYFGNGGDEEYYIGSADCMTRNLESRVEILAPVESDELRTELRFILDTQLGDQRGAWDMQADGSYRQRTPADDDTALAAQEQFIERADARFREATRLRRRTPRGIRRRN